MKNVNTKAKRTSITVAAAIAATLAIGTVGAGATGSFNQVFGENFAGEKVNGVYAGTNVNVKTADAYSAEFLGISGDRHNVMSAMKITKADGTGFTIADDAKYTYVSPIFYGISFNGDDEKLTKALSLTDEDKSYNGTVEVSKSLWNQVTNSNNTSSIAEGGQPEFILEDNNTIKCIEYYSGGQYELIGETMTMYEPIVYIYSIKDDALRCNMEEGYNAIGLMNGYGEDYNTPAAQKIAEKLTAVRNNLKENEYLIVNSNGFYAGGMTFSVAEISAEKIDVSGSWKLNYKSEESRKFDVNGKSFSLSGNANGKDFSEVQINLTSLEAETFSTSIAVEFKGNVNAFCVEENDCSMNKWFDAFTENFGKDIVITLENGEKVNGSICMSSTEYDSNGGTSLGQIFYIRDNHTVTLSPSEITSISFDGVELL